MSGQRFALIAEGESDFEVIRHILAGFFADPDVIVNQIQPAVDVTGAAGKPAGGWSEVLRFCRSDKFREAFQFNDVVIIQIDTDVCEEVGFGVSRRTPDGEPRSIEEMIDATCARLIEVIGPESYEHHRGQILFAICVESIECWLLPLYYKDDRRAKHVNCLRSLNEQLNAREGFSIDPERKQIRYYKQIARAYKKPRILSDNADANPSLARFVRDLRAGSASWAREP